MGPFSANTTSALLASLIGRRQLAVCGGEQSRLAVHARVRSRVNLLLMSAVSSKGIFMRVLFSIMQSAALSLLCTATVQASEETQLVAAINLYRAQAQTCAGQGTLPLPPLVSDARLVLGLNGLGGLHAPVIR